MTDISREAVEELCERLADVGAYDFITTTVKIRALRDALDKAEAELQKMALQVIASEGQACDAYTAQQKAEDERDCLKAAILSLSRACPHPNKQASTCGFESCPDCGARLEED